MACEIGLCWYGNSICLLGCTRVYIWYKRDNKRGTNVSGRYGLAIDAVMVGCRVVFLSYELLSFSYNLQSIERFTKLSPGMLRPPVVSKLQHYTRKRIFNSLNATSTNRRELSTWTFSLDATNLLYRLYSKDATSVDTSANPIPHQRWEPVSFSLHDWG